MCTTGLGYYPYLFPVEVGTIPIEIAYSLADTTNMEGESNFIEK